MKQTVKTALEGVREAIQRMDEPIDPEGEAMELTPAMISNTRKIAPTGTALEQEVAARMRDGQRNAAPKTGAARLEESEMMRPVGAHPPPAPAADRDAPMSEILQGMQVDPPPLLGPGRYATVKQPPASAPADYGRDFYLRQVFGLVGVALLKVAEPDYGVSTCREIADQLVMTYTIIRQLEGRVEQVLSILQRGAPGVGDVVSLADQSTLNLARQCLAAERQIRDRLQEIERKLER